MVNKAATKSTNRKKLDKHIQESQGKEGNAR